MKFTEGHGKLGGRAAGTPNKSTLESRKAIAAFVDGNVDRLTGWLDEIATKDPRAAFDCFMDVVEYHIPKLARTEHMSDPDNPVVPSKIEIVLRNATGNT